MSRWMIAAFMMIGLLAASARAADPLRDEVESALRHNHLETWFPRIVDTQDGGFLCDFDAGWKPAGSQPKSIVYQARAVWTASQAAMRSARSGPIRRPRLAPRKSS